MNKNSIITIFTIIILIVLGLMFWKTNDSSDLQMTDTQVLDEKTQDDSIAEIEASLKAIDIETSSPEDMQKQDEDIKSL